MSDIRKKILIYAIAGLQASPPVVHHFRLADHRKPEAIMPSDVSSHDDEPPHRRRAERVINFAISWNSVAPTSAVTFWSG